MNKRVQGVYVITDATNQRQYTHTRLAEMAVQGGANIVQFRDKTLGARESLTQAESIAGICNKYEAISVVNDRVDLALAVGATGVHLGQNDLPLQTARRLLGNDKIIGGTSSTVEEALQVQQEGADYVALGHIFKTATKQNNYPPRGLNYLHNVCEAVEIPVVAIGGITLQNAPDVIAEGADMIAVSSAVCCADDPIQATAELADLFS